MDRYTHTVRGELSDALAVLPDLSEEESNRMKATGTHNERANVTPNKSAEKNVTKSCQSKGQSGVKGTGWTRRERLGIADHPEMKIAESFAENRENPASGDDYKSLGRAGVEPATHGFSVRCSTN